MGKTVNLGQLHSHCPFCGGTYMANYKGRPYLSKCTGCHRMLALCEQEVASK